MPIKAKFDGNYRKLGKNGVPFTVFRYTVTGSPEEMEQYKSIQGDNYRADEKTGKPLWFTTRYISDNVSLIITSGDEPKIVADDADFAKIQSLVQSYGADVAKLVLGMNAPRPATAE
jgi:hypothetical protein